MIIPNKPVASAAKVYGDQNKITKTAGTEKKGAVQPKDEVILSSNGQEFSHILQAIRNLPDVREDKVKDLSAQLDAGSYSVRARDIAEKIMQNK